MRQICQGQILIGAAIFIAILMINSAFGGTADPDSAAYWIAFRNKCGEEPIRISERAIERRRDMTVTIGQTWSDLPVCNEYVEGIRRTGAHIRRTSRWLNAVSVTANKAALGKIRKLPFVDDVRKVSSYSRPRTIPDFGVAYRPTEPAVFDYGPSYNQISMIGIDSLHNDGLSGVGVLIGIIDTGFDTSHTVFSHLRAENRIVATYDFINDDSNVVDMPDAQRTHGTQVLSALSGFHEGFLIGPAYGAEFILAKTEIVFEEIEAEEDNWVAAAEWMESLGVDIISSSVGYIDWYDTIDLDGQTAMITRAANTAVSLGVIVVNAAGNEGNTSWRHVIPPADGDSVIAVGAVQPSGIIVNFSSRGPTSDGRIKPDFCAQGASVYLANWSGGYSFAGGTSFSAPQIAGGIALLLEGHPEWTLGDILSAMKTASTHNSNPDNIYGWGIPNFALANRNQPFQPSGSAISISIIPHPAVDSAVFHLITDGVGTGDLLIHDASGLAVRRIRVIAEGGETIEIWDGNNDSGRRAASGIYICVFSMGGSHAREKFFFVSDR